MTESKASRAALAAAMSTFDKVAGNKTACSDLAKSIQKDVVGSVIKLMNLKDNHARVLKKAPAAYLKWLSGTLATAAMDQSEIRRPQLEGLLRPLLKFTGVEPSITINPDDPDEEFTCQKALAVFARKQDDYFKAVADYLACQAGSAGGGSLPWLAEDEGGGGGDTCADQRAKMEAAEHELELARIALDVVCTSSGD